MNTLVKRSFKYRFYPTEAQAAELSRTFGCVRKVYNMALQARTEAWTLRGERLDYNATSAMLTTWKRTEELSFLNEVSSVPLQQSLRHLQKACFRFWAKRAKYPRFKSCKRSRASAEYTRSAFRFRDGALTLAKMREPLDIRWSRPLPEGAMPSTVTVSRDPAERWFVSLRYEDSSARQLPLTDTAVGIDVGLNHLLTLSTGEKIANPRHQRRDHLHKITTRLVRENQTLVIEDLTVRNMVKNRTLAHAISDASWAEIRSMLKYKAAWYGRSVIAVDRWLPSSKLCSVCGALAAAMPLRVRTWTCSCDATHDRDVNAARNILAAGLAATVCGADVRPQRNTPGGQSAAKQKASQREPWDSPCSQGRGSQGVSLQPPVGWKQLLCRPGVSR
ncbi:RNA-guided endonuclease InsQ/TnpB family protein [Lentzea alba]|uniref:RNA-guided endonuclease InsQ/TnpB family protein n=1 Tax=Lentzea alba TaxID=2714351 RepID=UPI0028BDC9C3|nr:transposase [Lentzea alba]